jgi:hypothetical protein
MKARPAPKPLPEKKKRGGRKKPKTRKKPKKQRSLSSIPASPSVGKLGSARWRD